MDVKIRLSPRVKKVACVWKEYFDPRERK